jgi:prolipoprotein diacylglyceryltransferase
MAVNAKTGLLVVAAIFALLIGGGVLWFLTMQKWATAYQETNATWRITGVCINAQNGEPIQGALVTASFREAIAFKHHWRDSSPPRITDVVAKTEPDGRFVIIGNGGSVYVTAKFEGYRDPEPWENWSCSARNGSTHMDTNIVLSLQPALESTKQGK